MAYYVVVEKKTSIVFPRRTMIFSRKMFAENFIKGLETPENYKPVRIKNPNPKIRSNV